MKFSNLVRSYSTDLTDTSANGCGVMLSHVIKMVRSNPLHLFHIHFPVQSRLSSGGEVEKMRFHGVLE